MALNTAVSISPRDNFPDILRGKRVLLTTESLGPVNGVSRTTRSLIDYLHRNGVDLAVVAPHFEGQQQQQADERLFREVRIPGYPLPYNPDLTVVYPFHLDDVYRQTFEPDVIYLASPASLGFQMLLLLRQLRRSPVVLLNFQTDLSAYSEILLPAPLDRFAVWLLATVQGYLFSLPAVHTIFYPSSAIRGYLEKTGAPQNRFHKLGRGVDTSLFNPSHRDESYRQSIAPNNEIILVYVCRLAPEKGFDFLSQVATQLAAANLPFKILIVGGNRNPAVETRIHRLFDEVRDHVIFTGFLTGVDLARAYAAGDLFLHCSVTETFGLVVLEAMASGLPVIARDQGGPSDIIRNGQTGYLMPPDDLDGFVKLVRQVSIDGGLRSNLSSAARGYADVTTWEAINRRVAWQIADAVESRPLSRAPVTPLHMVWVLVEKMRLLAAIGMVYLMWLIAVVPLIMHGETIPRLRAFYKAWK
ncbi:glycosyltransferase family 4 protein [Aspergillus ruber CBS 135680]|uniref:Putative glycosyl transferase n=1 Tax=Aspergillus ruber (strain CBS 135680) TaxID=1388766 RepID=A0A017SPA5_ASPRC|nr:putative glycosyl transferase [Aspergillus ruber CBS 135680]EYE98802.1 putative glycosyl transferase [Aspergillus ruber CBS 135680]